MDKPSARQWLQQASSDLEAADFLLQADAISHCHTVAKYQQCVEKAVKAMVAALNEAKIVSNDPTFNHDVGKELNVLINLPRSERNQSVSNLIKGVLNDHRREEIRALGALAPVCPGPGQKARRNTEYPYQNDNGEWTYPAADGDFTNEQARRFQITAERVCRGASQVLAALNRVPR